MLHKTHGVVFRFTRFRETSVIASIFTARFGLQSYIINSVRTAKSRMALFQPLTLLDMVVYHRENANINRTKEVKCLYPYQTLHRDIRKSAIAIFITEVLNKTVKEESHSEEMFNFISQSLMQLDGLKEQYENFHLHFLIGLSRRLGFGLTQAEDAAFHFAGDEESLKCLEEFLAGNWQITMPVQRRRALLQGLLQFYQSHLDTMGELKSAEVLRGVLD
ncbi:MAG: DNA repair protein RecO [Cyclobacteriaceae bacterium]|nr:MAG: DNA repair protein RecO [Cyclobacteriaceae bacterium]